MRAETLIKAELKFDLLAFSKTFFPLSMKLKVNKLDRLFTASLFNQKRHLRVRLGAIPRVYHLQSILVRLVPALPANIRLG